MCVSKTQKGASQTFRSFHEHFCTLQIQQFCHNEPSKFQLRMLYTLCSLLHTTQVTTQLCFLNTTVSNQNIITILKCDVSTQICHMKIKHNVFSQDAIFIKQDTETKKETTITRSTPVMPCIFNTNNDKCDNNSKCKLWTNNNNSWSLQQGQKLYHNMKIH